MVKGQRPTPRSRTNLLQVDASSGAGGARVSPKSSSHSPMGSGGSGGGNGGWKVMPMLVSFLMGVAVVSVLNKPENLASIMATRGGTTETTAAAKVITEKGEDKAAAATTSETKQPIQSSSSLSSSLPLEGRKPNHFDPTNIVSSPELIQALQYAMEPGRGYQPSRDRADHQLPVEHANQPTGGSFWWTNGHVPESFSVGRLDTTYPTEYFSGGGHPSNNDRLGLTYIRLIQAFGGVYWQRPVTSVVEFGNGGGVYAEVFYQKYKHNFVTVEGSGAGCKLTIEKHKVAPSQVVQHDLRLPIYLGRRFDVAICTEVVEHVEPPFASQIVLNLVIHADAIWFSFKDASPHHQAWINHPNERPVKMWKNLFDFYGYDIVEFPYAILVNTYYRGNFLAYKRNRPGGPLTWKDLEAVTEPQDLVIKKAGDP